MKITSDPIIKRGTVTGKSKYAALFESLTPENNCIAATCSEDVEAFKGIGHALNQWSQKHRPGTKVASTKAYSDGFPRVWLVFPEPPKTTLRGNFPKENKA